MLQVIASGIVSGSLYALIALGFVMIYKTTDILNFGQGEACMLGAYFGLMLHINTNFSYFMILVLAIFIGLLLGVAIDILVCRPLIKSPIMVVIIATLALSIILQNSAQRIWGTTLRSFPSVFNPTPLNIYGVSITPHNLCILIVTTILMIIFISFLKFTKLGKAMRASQQNRDAAMLMGINVKRVFSLTWGISFGIGTCAGVLFAPLVPIEPTMGAIIIKAFAGAILGGLGSLLGAVIGGLSIGVIENIAGFYISTVAKPAIAFLVILVILIFRPSGLFGKIKIKKV
jgi:branched-chain amino acid transport system permease protein